MALRTESYSPRTAPTITTAAVLRPEAMTQLRAGALAAEIASTVSKLRDQLLSSAQLDKLGLCKVLDPDTFYPHGLDAECRARQVRHQGSEFRKGIRNHFKVQLVNERQAAANALIGPLAQMISTEAPSVASGEALSLIADDYGRIFGAPPPASTFTAAASALPSEPVAPSRMPTEVTPTPLPQVPSEGPTQILPGALPGMPTTAPTPVPEGMTPMPGTSPFAPTEAPLPGEAPAVGEIPWLWIGAGAVVLAGGAYLLTRKK